MRTPLPIALTFCVLAACTDPNSAEKRAEIVKPAPPIAPATVVPPEPVALGPVPTLPAIETPLVRAINQAEFGQAAESLTAAEAGSAPTGEPRPDPLVVKAQVLLDRARFAPGVIDGRQGGNLRLAIMAFERANDLMADGTLDADTWRRLSEVDTAPVLVRYVLTAEDVAGPFLGGVPEEMPEQARLEHLGYADATEALAEKFHMDPKLLKALNPDADLTVAGAEITVASPRSGVLPEVARIEVDKSARAVRAYDASDRLVALYPASVGSAELPAPSGTWAVNSVAPEPVYYYDPARLRFGRAEAKGKLKIAAGPNNPVGSTWIDLTKDTYGIHGSPEPETVGKQQSHGCVRLTNWDAAELGRAVKKGVAVVFVGADAAKPTKRG